MPPNGSRRAGRVGPDDNDDGKSHDKYCFTLNNPTDDDYARMAYLAPSPVPGQPPATDSPDHPDPRLDGLQWIIAQTEIGAGGTPHFQGCVHFRSRLSYNSANAVLGFHHPARLAYQRGSATANVGYTHKANHGVPPGDYHSWEWGTPMRQGKRSDLEGFRRDVNSGQKSYSQLQEDHLVLFMRPHNAFDKYISGVGSRTSYQGPILCECHFGDPGTGKTTSLDRRFPGTFIPPSPTLGGNRTLWFDRYDGGPIIQIDDFRGFQFDLSNLLKLLDRRRYTLNVKGSTFPRFPNFKPTPEFPLPLIHITSNYAPWTWYGDRVPTVSIVALLRRFSKFYKYIATSTVLDPVTQGYPSRVEEITPDQAIATFLALRSSASSSNYVPASPHVPYGPRPT